MRFFELLATAVAVSAAGAEVEDQTPSAPIGMKHVQQFVKLQQERQQQQTLKLHDATASRLQVDEEQAKEPRFLNNQTESMPAWLPSPHHQHQQ